MHYLSFYSSLSFATDLRIFNGELCSVYSQASEWLKRALEGNVWFAWTKFSTLVLEILSCLLMYLVVNSSIGIQISCSRQLKITC